MVSYFVKYIFEDIILDIFYNFPWYIKLIFFISVAIFYYLIIDKYHIQINDFIKNKKRLFTIGIIGMTIVTGYLVYDEYYYPDLEKDTFTVAISPIYQDGKQSTGIVNEIKKKTKNISSPNKINLITLDEQIQPVDHNMTLRNAKKTGAHLLVYWKVISYSPTLDADIEYNIVPTYPDVLSQEIENIDILDNVPKRTSKYPIYNHENNSNTLNLITNDVSTTINLIYIFNNYYLKNYENALNAFQSITNYENNSDILYYSGNCYAGMKNYNKSLNYFNASLLINPNSTSTLLSKALILDILGKHTEAIDVYDQALKINPENIIILNNKKLALDKL